MSSGMLQKIQVLKDLLEKLGIEIELVPIQRAIKTRQVGNPAKILYVLETIFVPKVTLKRQIKNESK